MPNMLRSNLISRCLLCSVALMGVMGRAWAQNELFVSDTSGNSITVYNRTANGNTAPIRTLFGAATGLAVPTGIVVDTVNSELVVANNAANWISVFGETASGNTAPARILGGASTGLANPDGIAVDTVNNELFVANNGGTTINVYSRTANGNTAPTRILNVMTDGRRVFVDTVNNELFVANASNSSIFVYSRTASGNDAPLRTLVGASTGLAGPLGVVVDTVNNELLVGNQSSVLVYSRTASGNTAPTRTLSGASTGLIGASFLAVTPVPVAHISYTVSPSVGTGSGFISPNTPQTVNAGATATFAVTPASGYQIANVGGTCGGALSGNTYTTHVVAADCTVIAAFSVLPVGSTPTVSAPTLGQWGLLTLLFGLGGLAAWRHRVRAQAD